MRSLWDRVEDAPNQGVKRPRMLEWMLVSASYGRS